MSRGSVGAYQADERAGVRPRVPGVGSRLGGSVDRLGHGFTANVILPQGV